MVHSRLVGAEVAAKFKFEIMPQEHSPVIPDPIFLFERLDLILGQFRVHFWPIRGHLPVDRSIGNVLGSCPCGCACAEYPRQYECFGLRAIGFDVNGQNPPLGPRKFQCDGRNQSPSCGLSSFEPDVQDFKSRLGDASSHNSFGGGGGSPEHIACSLKEREFIWEYPRFAGGSLALKQLKHEGGRGQRRGLSSCDRHDAHAADSLDMRPPGCSGILDGHAGQIRGDVECLHNIATLGTAGPKGSPKNKGFACGRFVNHPSSCSHV